MILYVVRNTAPSAGSNTGPPMLPPIPSSRPSGMRYALRPPITISSPGRSVGVKILGYMDKKHNEVRTMPSS